MSPRIKKLQFNQRKVERDDKLRTAWHEAGHYVAAQSYKLNASCLIYRLGDASLDTKAFVGKTFFDFTTPLRRAVIGWAGLIAEDFYDSRVTDEDIQLEPDVRMYDYHMTTAWELSLTDQVAIGEKPWRAFQSAWTIVFRHETQIEQIAKKLARAPAHSYQEAMCRLRNNAKPDK